MKCGAVGAVTGAVTVAFLFAGCGSGTPDTEGQTLTQAQQTLRDARVPAENVSVTGETGDPDVLIVCDHDPDGVAPTQQLTLEVAANCPQDDDDSSSKRKKKKRR